MYRESGPQDSGVLCIRAVFVLFVFCYLQYTIFLFLLCPGRAMGRCFVALIVR